MSFSNVLKEAVERVNGAISAMILGSDGMPVEEHTTEGILNIDDLSAESSQMIQDMNTAAETLKLGNAQEFMVVSDLCAIIVRRITQDYYLALVIRSGGNYGKGRFILRVLAARIEDEF
jgi:predicted regulator of Ras-like GTPase activity (Roadblock/LC7/MglB family)